MVGISYHELQANSASGQQRSTRHTAAERKQFLVVCVIGFGLLANAFINAGLFESINPNASKTFPGGEFVYKVAKNQDYASTGGYWRKIARDLRGDLFESSFATEKETFDDDLFSVYIDDVSKGYGRFFTGVITQNKPELKKKLINLNPGLGNRTGENYSPFDRMEYEVGILPKVESISTTFPFTDGFVSALLHNYKVFPALAKYAKEKFPDEKIVIVTTCNRNLKVCTHYVPVKEGEKFLMGHPNTEDWTEEEMVDLSFDAAKISRSLKRLVGMKTKEEL